MATRKVLSHEELNDKALLGEKNQNSNKKTAQKQTNKTNNSKKP